MAVYTVSITDGTTLSSLAVSAGRGPKGDGFTGGTYNASTGVVTFTSNDGIGFSTDDLRGNLSEPGPIGDVTPNTGNFTTLTASGDLTVDTNTLYVDSVNNRVGIGTSSPASPLTVKSNSSAVGMGILCRSSNDFGFLQFKSTDDAETIAEVSVNRTAANTGSLRFSTSNGGSPAERMRIDSSGNVGIGTSSPTNLLDVNADSIRVRTAQTPASASATGNQGEIAWDADYIYVCVATNTWKRAALTTW